MNTIKIKLDPFKDINTVSLDNRPLSIYSELNNYMREPFLSWASKLLDAAEREVNDEYAIVLTSCSFESLFTEGMKNCFESCKEIITDNFQIDISISERFEMVKELAEKYGIVCSAEEYRIPIYTDMDYVLDPMFVNVSEIENAKVIITNNDAVNNKVENLNNGVIVLLVSEDNKVVSCGTEKYIWEIREDDLDIAVNSIIDRFVKVPVIVKNTEKLSEIIDRLDCDERKILAMVTEIDPFVTIDDVPKIEVGETIELKVNYFPKENNTSNLRIVPQNMNIVVTDGLNITAVGEGTTFIDLYKDEENVPFERKTISTYKNNYVRQIDLKMSSDNMGISQKQHVEIFCMPSDADDANMVIWTSDDEDIVSVSKDGELFALKEGVTTITASTKMATASVTVKVLPNIKKIVMDVMQSDLYVGEKCLVNISYEPANCFDSSYKWKSSDKDVAVIEKSDDGNIYVKAQGIGNCTLTCFAKEGGASVSCDVSVKSTFYREENNHKMLSFTLIATIICLFCAVFNAHTAVVLAGIATLIFGISAMVKNKTDRVSAVLLMAAAVFITAKYMGIIESLG
ncbi:MAG: Ig-like domain-containing protein [Lachnospiraceae bacterium]|nr:Ig-like domain-containing protein [Lachnospiraceae bacterium]